MYFKLFSDLFFWLSLFEWIKVMNRKNHKKFSDMIRNEKFLLQQKLFVKFINSFINKLMKFMSEKLSWFQL